MEIFDDAVSVWYETLTSPIGFFRISRPWTFYVSFWTKLSTRIRVAEGNFNKDYGCSRLPHELKGEKYLDATVETSEWECFDLGKNRWNGVRFGLLRLSESFSSGSHAYFVHWYSTPLHSSLHSLGRNIWLSRTWRACRLRELEASVRFFW